MEAAAARCQEIQEELSRIDDKNDVLIPIIVAARGIELLKRAAIQIVQNGKMDAAMKAAFERWLEEYKPCWLRYDKQSELVEIEKFVQSICS